jgi:hypothetical protein
MGPRLKLGEGQTLARFVYAAVSERPESANSSHLAIEMICRRLRQGSDKLDVVALCYCPDDGGPMLSVPEVSLVAGSGIVGDRYYGAKQRYSGQNLTLIEAEEIEAFNARNGTSIELTGPRRNVVTRNVRLNLLVGREFSIGTIRLRGVELCEPCRTLASHLAAAGLPKARFVREFRHRAGLRVDVLTSGSIRVSDQIVVLP